MNHAVFSFEALLPDNPETYKLFLNIVKTQFDYIALIIGRLDIC